MQAHLQGSWRVYNDDPASGTTRGGTIAWPAGGGFVAWYIGKATYDTQAEIAAAIEAAIETATSDTDWSVTASANAYTIARTDDPLTLFNITFDDVTACITGFTAGTHTGASSYTSDSAPEYSFYPLAALSDDSVVRVYYRGQTWADGSVSPQTVLRAKRTYFRARVEIRGPDEVTQWRRFLLHARRGVPFRVFVDDDVSTAWANDNRGGYLDCALDHDGRQSAETFLREDSTFIQTYDLAAVVL